MSMGMTIVQGRSFTRADRQGNPRVAVISHTAARRVFSETSPLGRFFSNGDRFDPATAVEVVGVVRDLRYNGPRDPHGIVAFQPLEQVLAPLTSVVLRTRGAPYSTQIERQLVWTMRQMGLIIYAGCALNELRPPTSWLAWVSLGP